MIIRVTTMWIATRLYFAEYRHEFDSILLFSQFLLILRFQFSTKGPAPSILATKSLWHSSGLCRLVLAHKCISRKKGEERQKEREAERLVEGCQDVREDSS